MNTESKPAKLRILVCGGTFDKEYDEISGKLFFRDTHISEMLDLGRSRLPVQVEKVFLIDSLEMTDEHRSQILSRCQQCSEKQIVITHGTDTMNLTAKVLGDAKIDKTIIITGAMIPYKFGSSDGLYNLGAALAYAQALPSGVYVTMSGKLFFHNNFKKNRSTGQFESTDVNDS